MTQPSEIQHNVLIPEPVLQRLPWYLAYVSSLRAKGVTHVSSTQISRQLNVESSQIAKDLSFLTIRGKTRIGYEVALLEEKLKALLGFDESHPAVICGVGSLGGALLQDTGLRKFGLNIIGAFDISDHIIGSQISGITVSHIDTLGDFCRQTDVEIGIITVPSDTAQHIADSLVHAGVQALWNFTPRHIIVESPVVLTNTSLYAHLAVMYNKIKFDRNENTRS